MSKADQEAEQTARAKQLRDEIARITGKSGAAPGSSAPPSPRDFIEEKMRELRDKDPKPTE
jgi:hypothetical protein